MDTRELLADERRHLSDVLDGLSAEQWASPSLAEGWTVRDVVAHLVMPFRYSVPRFAFNLIKARGNFNRMADRVARRDAAALSPVELAGMLRTNAMHPWKPPGAGYEAPLTDLVMHSIDICRPLGFERCRPADATRLVLDNLTTGRSLKFFSLDLAGLHLQVPDVGWGFGSGALVTGPSDDLILTLGARPAGVSNLSGAGAPMLAAQLSRPS